MKNLKLILAVVVAIVLGLFSCETEEHFFIDIPNDTAQDKTIINNINNIINNYGDTINWNNPVTTYSIVPVESNIYCPNGGWETHVFSNGNQIAVLPGPCFQNTDTVVVMPEINFYSETVILDSLCNLRKFFSEINGEMSLIGADTVCNGKDGETPFIDLRITKFDSLCRIYEFQINDMIVSDTICDGEKGPKGDPGKDGESTIDTLIISKVDTLFIHKTDTIVVHEIDTVVVEGKDYLTFRLGYDFNIGHSGDDMQRGMKFDHLSTSRDMLNGIYNGKDKGYAIFQEFPEGALLVGVDYWTGQKLSHRIIWEGLDSSETWEGFLEFQTIGNSNFDRLNRSTFDERQSHILDFEDAKSKQFSKVKIVFEKIPGENYPENAHSEQYLDDIGFLLAIPIE